MLSSILTGIQEWITTKIFFESDGYNEGEEETEEKDNNDYNYEYDKTDENELANILQESNHFQVTHETEE